VNLFAMSFEQGPNQLHVYSQIYLDEWNFNCPTLAILLVMLIAFRLI